MAAMTMEKMKLLLAESDEASLQKLREALEKDEYEVLTATDGVQALQIALQTLPPIIILSLDLPLIDGVKLSQIVRTNPKTESIAIFYMNDRTIQISHFRRTTDHFIIKPFNVDELRKILNGVRKKLLSVQNLNREEEFSGNLKQMPLPDLLQVLAMNQRTGNLFILPDQNDKNRKAVIALRSGRIVNAHYGKAARTKALFRIVTLREGFFSFLPGEPELADEMNESTDSLIMEGLRQNDELQEMKKRLGAERVRVSLNISMEKLPKGLRPKTVELLQAIEILPELADLMDNLEMLDYEILKIIMGLREKGVVKIEEVGGEKTAAKVDFSSDAILELKKAVLKVHPGMQPPYSVVVPVFLESTEHAGQFLRALTGFSFAPSRDDVLQLKKGERMLGFLGTIRLVESLHVHVLYFCGFVPSRPFMNAFLSTAVGAIVTGDRERCRDAISYFGKRFAAIGPKEKIEFETVRKSIEKIFDIFTREHQ